MKKLSAFRRKTLAGLSALLFILGGLFGSVWLNSIASDSGGYTVETNITGSDIADLHANNLIAGKTPYFISGNHEGGDGEISEMTDGLGAHIDFWARDNNNLRFVYKLDRMETIGSLLYAGHNGASNATGRYEFYVSDRFNPLDEASYWTTDNLVVSYDNTELKTYSQKINFTSDNRPSGQYVGIRITDVSVAADEDNSRVAEIGVYPPTPAAGEIIVDAEAGRGGSISPAGTVIVKTGETQNFDVEAEEGFEVESVTVNGEEVQLTDGQYQFTAGEENAVIRATFINLLGYTVDAGIKDSDIKPESALYTSNLIKDKEPIFVSHTPEQDIMRLTDGIGVSSEIHVNFYVIDSDNLRMVYELDDITSVHELLYAGYTNADHTTGKYEFYVFEQFDPQNEPSPWPLENLVASYDNTVTKTNAQKITFEENNRPVGRYVGVRITDVSVFEGGWVDNNARIAEIGVYGEQMQAFSITAAAGEGGSISPSGTVLVPEGKSKTFTITPDDGYEVDAVEVDGEEVQLTDGKYVFNNVQADATITATFKITVPLIEDTDITASNISESHDDNLIKDLLPYFTGVNTGIDGSPAELTDGIGATTNAHVDFYTSLSDDFFTLVYDLRATTTIDALLCAGPNILTHVLGEYEFYVFNQFDNATSWTEGNKVYTYDNTEIKSIAQKINFYNDDKPVGRYVGIRITNACIAENDNCVRISELGVYGLRDNKAPTPNVTFHAATRTLSGTESGQKYRIDGGAWQDIVTDLSEIVTGACTIEIYMPGIESVTEDSNIQTITVGKATKPTVTGTNETFEGKNDGKISSVDSTMEYRKDGDQWQAVSGATIENLAPGTYHVRVKANGQTLESDYAVVVIVKGDQEYTQQSISAPGQDVSVSGLLTEGAVLSVDPIAAGNIDYDALLSLVDTDANTIIAAFNVAVTEGEYTGNLTLTFTVGEENNGKTLTIYHKNENGQTKTYTAECTDGKITIIVEELSPFLLAAPKNGENTGPGGDTTSPNSETTSPDGGVPSDSTPPTGERNNMVPWLMLMFAGIAGVFTFSLHCQKTKSAK